MITASTSGTNTCLAGEEVVFIYGPSRYQPCHAVVKNVDGPWSRNRVGFCGHEPDYGPMPWCKAPNGDLCPQCATYVEKIGDRYFVKANALPVKFFRSRLEPQCECDDG